MLASTSISIVVFMTFTAHTLGLAVPRTESSEYNADNLRDMAEEYVAEITFQSKAIEDLENQLALGEEGSVEVISKASDQLVESYYRQMEPRSRMVELSPTDTVLDINSIEYLVAVGSRYADNVMHFARQIRSNPIDEQRPMIALQYLRKEHKKVMMFDQILYGLANLAMNKPSSESPVAAHNKDKHTQENVAVTSANHATPSKVHESLENTDTTVSVHVEEEVQTTTTETVVTSYKETTVSW